MQRALDRGAAHDGHAVYFRRDAGSHAHAVQIERQAVAQIDAGSSAATQALSESQARLDGPVPRLAEAPGDVESIAGTRAAAKQGFPSRDAAAHRDIAMNFFGVRQVPAGQSGAG